MKILHYALGFPPYRSGGLTKYCIDLLLAQKEEGHDVAMMWPGAFSFSGHFVRLKKGKKLQLFLKEGRLAISYLDVNLLLSPALWPESVLLMCACVDMCSACVCWHMSGCMPMAACLVVFP